MKRLLATLMGGIALASPLLHADQSANEDVPHVLCDGHRLTFGWHGGAPHRVDVSNLIRAATLDSAKVLSAERAGDVDYFVVSVSGPSPSWQAGNSNSGGTESNLLWLKLRSWKLLDSQSMQYQSYWDALDPIGTSHLMGGVLTLRFTNRRQSIDYVLRYDSAHPDEKISIIRAADVE